MNKTETTLLATALAVLLLLILASYQHRIRESI